MKFLRKFADNTNRNSIVNKWRKKRFKIFKEMLDGIPKPVKILDIGGTENFWIQMDFVNFPDVTITILNSQEINITLPYFKFVKGDAKDMNMFADNEFDIAFSNSVIEHVGNYNDQKKTANEIKRVAKRYFVQTPNYYFPMEPHFLFPFFQFLPLKIKIFLLMNFKMGWYEKCNSYEEVLKLINSIRLLKKRELEIFFPFCRINREKLFGLTKSFIITN
ncbi:MAG: class I SAM-dependent methyltransferase [Chlorobi bacterium]|nr:class I SAM-dependent methyltransferase [Chlorobiota bacterium]MCI0716899.1 class I SAM-dependent methyltransferase [Chlorobiota bacterium]